jgi:hypothetical protein
MEIPLNSLDNLLKIIGMTDEEFCRYSGDIGLPMDWVNEPHALINEIKVSIARSQLKDAISFIKGVAQ